MSLRASTRIHMVSLDSDLEEDNYTPSIKTRRWFTHEVFPTWGKKFRETVACEQAGALQILQNEVATLRNGLTEVDAQLCAPHFCHLPDHQLPGWPDTSHSCFPFSSEPHGRAQGTEEEVGREESISEMLMTMCPQPQNICTWSIWLGLALLMNHDYSPGRKIIRCESVFRVYFSPTENLTVTHSVPVNSNITRICVIRCERLTQLITPVKYFLPSTITPPCWVFGYNF